MHWAINYRTCKICARIKGAGVDHSSCSKKLQAEMGQKHKHKKTIKVRSEKQRNSWAEHVGNNYT